MADLIQAGGDFVTEGERRAALELKQLPATWVVIANKTLATGQRNSYEIDFIVIADRNVFAIDEKGWRGRIYGSDEAWVREDGSSARSPLGKIDYVAKVLRGYLDEKVPSFRDIEAHAVTGLVLLSNTAERPSLRDPRAARQVVLLSGANAHLQALDREGGYPRVGERRNQIRAALIDLSDRPKVPHAIGDYAIEEMTPGRDGTHRIYRARHALGEERILTVYPAPSTDPELRNTYLHEYRALKDLEQTGVVPRVYDPSTWSEDFLVVPSAPPSGQSLSALPPLQSREDAERALDLAADAFVALARIHAAHVVHRAIGPDTVYVSGDRAPSPVMFTGFFAARRPGEQTISPRLDELKLNDPYAAPELRYGYGFATPESDTYSLALTLLERLSGIPIDRLVDGTGRARIPDASSGWPYLPEDIVRALITFFGDALTAGPTASADSAQSRRLTATECADRLREIARQLRGDIAIAEGGLLDGRYRVEHLLGQGASARTFLAADTVASGLFALKQFLRPATMEEAHEARSEFDILRNFPHPHLPRVYDVYPSSHDVHVKMEYIEGTRLSALMPEYRGDLERTRRLAAGLLDAIDHLERHRLLHRDVKPDNIIIRAGTGEAVLIDFGAATPAGVPAATAGTVAFLPPEALFAAEPPPSTDRYAAAVLLFRALTGRDPFIDEGGLEHLPLNSLDFLPPEQRAFASTLLRAVAPDPAQRYSSTREFRTALLPQPQTTRPVSESSELPDLINGWVDSVRGLFRNSMRGNADNRGLDSDFARETYVPTALDTRLLPAIFEREPRVVFLTGNPGDGKTAFLEQVRQALRDRHATRHLDDESGWEWRLVQRAFRACYDASESHGGLSADEQLLKRLDGLQGHSPRADLTVLIAINDGRLADFLDHHRADFPWLVERAERARGQAELEPAGVWLIDLKRRAYVALQPRQGEPSVMRRVLTTLTASEHWAICEGCAAQTVCPLRRNALVLGDETDAESATRLEEALLLAHLRGQRHLTMRDLRSGLAYLLTGDASCGDVHAARHTDEPLSTVDYWRLAFATPPARDIMLGELKPLDPARFARPRLERFFYFQRTPADAGRRAALFRDGRDLPPGEKPLDWLGEVKRRLSFESSPALQQEIGQDWRALLPYRHAAAFTAVLSGERPAAELLPSIARGLGRSDGISGRVLEFGVCLKVTHSDVNRLTVLKQFPLEQFRLSVQQRPASELIESFPQTLELRHKPSGARLLIPLDLFELLLRLAEGLEPESAELRPMIEDLAPFKSRVQLSNSKDLVLVENGRSLHRLVQRGGRVRLLPFTETQETTAV